MKLEEKTLQEKIIIFFQAHKLQSDALASIVTDLVKRQDDLESLLAKKLGVVKDEALEEVNRLKKNFREIFKE